MDSVRNASDLIPGVHHPARLHGGLLPALGLWFAYVAAVPEATVCRP
jgi:hypothetical protein